MLRYVMLYNVIRTYIAFLVLLSGDRKTYLNTEQRNVTSSVYLMPFSIV